MRMTVYRCGTDNLSSRLDEILDKTLHVPCPMPQPPMAQACVGSHAPVESRLVPTASTMHRGLPFPAFKYRILPAGPPGAFHPPMTDPELQTAIDEVRRRTGRNLILFQSAEYCIKELVALGSLRLTPSNGPKSVADVVQGMKMETMGGMKNRLFEDHFHDGTKPCPDPPDTPDSPEIWVCATFAIAYPDLIERRAAVDRMIVERNELVHNLLPKLSPWSIDSINEVALWLDRQREEVLPTVDWLQEQLQTVRKQINLLVQFMKAEEGKEAMRTRELQQSPAIGRLASLAEASPEPGGWISVRDAYRRLDEDEQDEIARLRKDYHLTSLSAVIAASRLFDLDLAPGGQGPSKAFFRLKRESRTIPHDPHRHTPGIEDQGVT